MDALLSLVPGGGITALFAALVAFLAWSATLFIKGRRAGLDSAKAEKVDAYEKHLEDLARAHDARNRVPDGMPDDDPYRRD